MQQRWDTHYTKLGPAGIERDPATTIAAALAAHLGFCVPFTLAFGGLAGCLVAAFTDPRTAPAEP